LPRSSFESAAKGDDLALLYTEYRRLLKAEKLVDYVDVIERALVAMESRPDAHQQLLLLLPENLECLAKERELLARFAAEQCLTLPIDAYESATLQWQTKGSSLAIGPAHFQKPAGCSVRMVRAIGEVNEVRGALRTCLAHEIRWDEVEILHADPVTYPSLVYETLAALAPEQLGNAQELPVTFAEGISCLYSKPGRALRLWRQWIEEDFPQSILVRLIREGLLVLPETAAERGGFARFATLFQGAAIGFGRERYLRKLDEALQEYENRHKLRARAAGKEDEGSNGRADYHADTVAAFVALRRQVSGLLDVTPDRDAPPRQLVTGAREFLRTCARATNKLDQFAVQKLDQELGDVEHWLSVDDEVGLNIWDWLEQLPAETRVLGSGPRSGCLHVDSLWSGGHAGRPHNFVLGLDDGRFPGAVLQDPLLLDSERRQLSENLPTAAQHLQEAGQKFEQLLARLRGQVHLSFACRSLDDDREMFPSPLLLPLFRRLTGRVGADQNDLLKELPPAECFAPAAPERCLNTVEWWLWRLTGDEQVHAPESLVFAHYPHLRRGRQATEQRELAEFTNFDGFVPEAGQDLDPMQPTGVVLSPSGLQTLGACPRRFYFQYALEIKPPDDIALDPDRWLDPLAWGSLLHELFEDFLRELLDAGRLPSTKRDLPRLLQLLDTKITKYEDLIPPPNRSSRERQCSELKRTAETFLREEEEYCAATQSVPIYLEASLGMPCFGHGTELDTEEPVAIALPDGQVIRVRGRVDRIDRVGPAQQQVYSIWDYKTGSSWGYDRANPFHEGRSMQAFLYVMMVGHRLRQTVSPRAQVKSFGFFFPGVKAAGERIDWAAAELKGGGEVLAQLCRTVTAGAFVATNNHQDDCKFCDYRPICGDVVRLSELTHQKLANPANLMLKDFRDLRRVVVE